MKCTKTLSPRPRLLLTEEALLLIQGPFQHESAQTCFNVGDCENVLTPNRNYPVQHENVQHHLIIYQI